MQIRTISAATVADTVARLFMDCNYEIGCDISQALERARKQEESPVGREVLTQLMENNRIAAHERIPICQDTGMAVLFVEYGDRVVIEGGSFQDRKSVV